AGGTVRARVKQTSGTTASQPLFPGGTEVVLRVRKVTSSPLITEVAISIVSATINGQSVPVMVENFFAASAQAVRRKKFRLGGGLGRQDLAQFPQARICTLQPRDRRFAEIGILPWVSTRHPAEHKPLADLNGIIGG